MDRINWQEAFAKLRGGDRDAFAQIYRELKQPVFTIAWRIVQSKETAEDITQEVFVKLFLSPPDPSVKNPRAWVFQMARNRSIDVLRKQKCTGMEELPPAAADPLDSAMLQWDIEAAIAALPPTEREILSLRLNGGLTFREISRIVGSSVPSVYRSCRKALNALRERLDGGTL